MRAASVAEWEAQGGDETATDREIARLAPTADGWTSEVLSDLGGSDNLFGLGGDVASDQLH